MRLARRRGLLVWGPIFAASMLVVVATASCAHSGAPATGSSDADATPSFGSDDAMVPTAPCVNLQCKRVDCGSAPKTSIRGVVHTGAKLDPDPVYNAIVYIPNETPAPFAVGVMCDHCGVITSGKPVSAAITAADGSFTLDDVPVGTDIPLVIQLGKWRRQVVISTVTACTRNELVDELTRFPRNRTEGDIPRIAVATGFIDPFECVLRSMGIDDAEFTPPTADGRVHVFDADGARVGPGTPSADQLWSDLATLKRYDMVLLPCEGHEDIKTPEATQNIIDYTAVGGRVMTSHYGYVWIAHAQMPFPSSADWSTNQGALATPLIAAIDRSFPKGQAMADWLRAVGASEVFGQIDIDEPRHDLGAARNGSRRWISAKEDPTTVLHLTFNTPIGSNDAAQCGRVVYSDFHVATHAAVASAPFPSECLDGPLTPTERVLEFMLLDLQTCIQNDDEYPKSPPAR